MDLDPIDAAILRALQRDPRASLRAIARKVGVSVPTVSAHLRNLEELGVVRGFRVVLDPTHLDSTSVTLVVKTEPAAADKVARQVADRDWARRVLTGPPGWILVDVGIGRAEDVSSILQEVSRLPGVADIQDFIGLKTVKDEPLPTPTGRMAANVACFECKGPIHGEPVRARRDGRYHYFCCHTCQRLYLERYDRIRTAAWRRA